MRINDILVESKVTEAPMGALSKIGNKVAAAFGSGKSQGKVDTGTTANELKQSYMRQLGQTGQEAEAKSLVAFLKAQGYPTAKAKAALGIVKAPVQATQAPQTAAPADAGRPQGGGKVAGQQSQTPGAVAKRNARRDATNATATTGGAGAFNQMTKQVTQPNDAAAQATAAVKGTTAPTTQLTTPDATQPAKSKALGPKGRATLGRLGKQKQVRASGNQSTLDLNSQQYTDNSILEALGDKQLDAAFLAAAQERAALGSRAPAADAPVDKGPSIAGTLARSALGMRQRGSSSDVGDTDTSSPLDGINVETLRAGLESVINDRPIDRSARVEIQKLIKQL